MTATRDGNEYQEDSVTQGTANTSPSWRAGCTAGKSLLKSTALSWEWLMHAWKVCILLNVLLPWFIPLDSRWCRWPAGFTCPSKIPKKKKKKGDDQVTGDTHLFPQGNTAPLFDLRPNVNPETLYLRTKAGQHRVLTLAMSFQVPKKWHSWRQL